MINLLKDFKGKTFVAFVDISGFKKVLLKNENEAEKILNSFYSIGYRELKKFNSTNLPKCYSLNGMFISDCGIIYVNFCKGYRYIEEPSKKKTILKEVLKDLLLCLKDICRRFWEEQNELLSVGVYYGDFVYQNRLEHENVEKNFIYGQGYLKAFELCENFAVGGEFICKLNELSNDLLDIIGNVGEYGIIIREIENKDIPKKNFRVYWMLEKDDDNKVNEIETYYRELQRLRKEKNNNANIEKPEIEREINEKYDEFKEKIKNLIKKNNSNW